MSYETAHSYWLTRAKRNPFPETPPLPRCWWCGGPPNTREHRIKRTDIVREFGKQPSPDHLLIVRARVTSPKRGPKADIWKFNASLCANCNNVRSQPLDRAQERFAKYLSENQPSIAKIRRIRFADIYPLPSTLVEADNLRRYFVKHVACRMYELKRPVSRNIVAFMNGTQPLRDIAFSFGFVPAVHKILENLPRDQSGVLGDEDLVRFIDGGTGRTYEMASDWTYQAFVLQWVYRWDCPEEPINPFSWDEVSLEECAIKMPAFFERTDSKITTQ